MDNLEIFVPFIGMLLLTAVVWVWMYVHRLSFIIGNRIDPQRFADSSQPVPDAPAKAVNTSNNFKNLFELPVLFYAVCLYLYVTVSVDQFYLNCAYIFLIFRALHSVIHCTFNNVRLRFAAYAVASLALMIMIVRIALAQFA